MRKHISNGKLMRQSIVLNGSADAIGLERSLVGGIIDVAPALKKSRVSQLHGRPYPVQFRNQGAFDAWRQALGSGADSVEAEAQAQVDARMQAVSISANLKYELQKGDDHRSDAGA
jgi:hypothetical protein